MNTFIEFLAKRDQDLLLEYAHEYKRILEQDEAPAQKTWYQKIGPAVMKAAAPLTAGLMLAGGMGAKAQGAPQDPSQGQKAPTSQTMKPDAKNPMQTNMNPMQTNISKPAFTQFENGLKQFVKNYVQHKKIDIGDGKFVEEDSFKDNVRPSEISYEMNRLGNVGLHNGNEVLQFIKILKDNLPNDGHQNILDQAQKELITTQMSNNFANSESINNSSFTPEQAKEILKNWSYDKGPHFNNVKEVRNKLNKIAQGQ